MPPAAGARAAAEHAAPECSICLCAMDAARGISAMPCGHVYCSACIAKAVSIRPICPVCRNRGTPIRLFIGCISSGGSAAVAAAADSSPLRVGGDAAGEEGDPSEGLATRLTLENATLSAQLQFANAEVRNKIVLLNAAQEQLTAVSAAFAREKDAQQSLVREVTAKLALAVDTKNKLLQDRISLKSEWQHTENLLRNANVKLATMETSHAEKMEQFKVATLRLKHELDRLKNIETEHAALQLRAGELEQQNQSLDLRLRRLQGLPPAPGDANDVIPDAFLPRPHCGPFQSVAFKPKPVEKNKAVEVISLDGDSDDEDLLEPPSTSSGTVRRRPLNAGLGNAAQPPHFLKPSQTHFGAPWRKLVEPPPKKQATLRLFGER